jgi:hypothetical protein
VLLHVSQETRALALRHYELSFEWKVPRVFYERLNLPYPDSSSSPSSSHQQEPNPSASARPESRDGSGSESRKRRSSSSPARTWFNFALDAVYLVGELEPYDGFGVGTPMPYFVSARTTRRVRKTALAFAALRFGAAGTQQILGTLFHVVDRFAPAGGDVLLCVTDRDEHTNALLGNETPLLFGDDGDGNNDDYVGDGGNGALGGVSGRRRRPTDGDNMVQKIWRQWYGEAVAASPLSKIRFALISEDELARNVYNFMLPPPAKQRIDKPL